MVVKLYRRIHRSMMFKNIYHGLALVKSGDMNSLTLNCLLVPSAIRLIATVATTPPRSAALPSCDHETSSLLKTLCAEASICGSTFCGPPTIDFDNHIFI